MVRGNPRTGTRGYEGKERGSAREHPRLERVEVSNVLRFKVSLPQKTHAIVATILAVTLAFVWLTGWTSEQEVNAAVVPNAEPPAIALPQQPPSPPPPEVERSTHTQKAAVRRGDTAAKIFQRHGLTERELHLVTTSGPLGRRLGSIFPGHEFEFEQDEEGNLVRLTYSAGRLETIRFERVGDEFKSESEIIEPVTQLGYSHAVLDRSLFVACQQAGLDDSFALKLANIFQWDVDFIRDIRKGDEFHVLYEERYLDGQLFDLGDILVAEFINQGTPHRAVRYSNKGEHGYYTPDGRNMQKLFLQAPLDFTRISSNFNLSRVHPLWKSSMPHRGIDYAAPTGTPVKAAGDGVVVAKSRTAPNGNFVVLRHGDKYHTKYLHLSSFARGLHVGKKVSQGEMIGRVGATGWATGPHLHYEFLVRGVHKNPRTLELPGGEPIPATDHEQFQSRAALQLAELERQKATRMVAAAETP